MKTYQRSPLDEDTPAMSSPSAPASTPEEMPCKTEGILDAADAVPSNRDVDVEGGEAMPMQPMATLNGTSDECPPPGAGEDGLQRKLQSRHMQMIAIGGNIGTGLLMGTGPALQHAGPAGLLLAFIYVAIMVYLVAMALAEMATLFPVSGSFVSYASRFIEPAWGFALGWTYLLQWLIALPIQLTVVTMLIAKWDNGTVTPGVWITLFLIAVSLMNFLGVQKYGRVEVFLSVMKVVAIAIWVVFAFVIDMGGGPGNHFRGGSSWSHPGAFNHGLKGMSDIILTGAFAYAGCEIVGLAAAESGNPRKDVPKATNQVFWTISFCNIISAFLIGLVIPFDEPRLVDAKGKAVSPFVLVLEIGGLKGLTHLFNAILLLSVFSVAISCVYAASRTLVALAQLGQAPRLGGWIDAKGRPMPAIGVALLCGCLAYVQYAGGASEFFKWLLALSGLATIFCWMSISLSHINFRRAWALQGHKLDELPFRSPVGVTGSVIALAMNVVVLVLHFWSAAWPLNGSKTPDERARSFFQAYLAGPFALLFYVIGKMILPGGPVSPRTVDLDTGRRQVCVPDHNAEGESGRTLWRKVRAAISRA